MNKARLKELIINSISCDIDDIDGDTVNNEMITAILDGIADCLYDELGVKIDCKIVDNTTVSKYSNILSNDVYEKIDNMILSGYSLNSISRSLGISRTTVTKRRDKLRK